MEPLDELHVLEADLLVLEAVARAVAYGSPSPAEEARSDLNARVLKLREDLGLDEHDEPKEVEDPAEEADAFEDVPEDVPAEPAAEQAHSDVEPLDVHSDVPAADSGSAEAPVADLPEDEHVEVAEAPAVVLPPAEPAQVDPPAEVAPEAAPAADAPAAEENKA
jgi:hypothetical protein